MESHPLSPAPARVSFAWAVAACACVLVWQFLTIHYNRQGNWTALFCTGQTKPIPPELQPGTYLFPGTGYDGQMYRYVAHDPLFRNGMGQYVDNPTMRYRRILVPALAFLFAGGRQPWIDGSYIAVTTLFILVGSYWLSRWAALDGFHPAWALAFPLVPAALISADRMTQDGALAALSVGFAYFSRTKQTANLYFLLVLACLVRETGVVLVAGCILFELLAKQFARSAIWATTCLPALGWALYLPQRFPVVRNISGVPPFLYRRLGLGIFGAILRPAHYHLSAMLETIARSLDVVSLIAVVGALIGAILLLRSRPLNPISITAVLYAALVIVLNNSRYWLLCFGYARVFSPLLVLVALQAMASKHSVKTWWWMVLPAPLVDLRVGLQLGEQIAGVFRGLLG